VPDVRGGRSAGRAAAAGGRSRGRAEILKAAPAALIGREAVARALAPLQELAEIVFFELTDRRFKSYEILRALRRGR